MKKEIKAAVLLLAAVAVSFSCQKEENKFEEDGFPKSLEADFVEGSGLTVSFEGTPVPCGSVHFSGEGSKAEVIIEGARTSVHEFLFGVVSDLLKSGEDPTVTSNLIPGSSSLGLNLDLNITGDTGAFSGRGKTQYCTYSYSGTVTVSSFAIDFHDVEVSGGQIVGTGWNLAKSTSGWKEMFIFDWTTNSGKPELYNVLSIVLEAYGQQLSESLAGVFEGIDFNVNGVADVRYYMGNGFVANTGVGMVDYVSPAEGQITCYLNLESVRKAITKDGETLDINAIVGYAAEYLAGNFRNGVPMHYSISGNTIEIWFDKNVVCGLLEAVAHILEMDGVSDLIAGVIQENIPGLIGSIAAGMVPALAEIIPDDIARTETLRLGLRMKRI